MTLLFVCVCITCSFLCPFHAHKGPCMDDYLKKKKFAVLFVDSG